MDIKELEQIIGILKNSDVSEFELDRDGTHVRISRGPRYTQGGLAPGAATPQQVTYQVVEQSSPVASGAPAIHAPHAASPSPVSNIPAHFVKVESPIVGTFYRKPSPDAAVFANEGDRVKKGDTLCIIEAMKLMNEIESPCDGKIERILLSDGKVVEFGEILFLINPQA